MPKPMTSIQPSWSCCRKTPTSGEAYAGGYLFTCTGRDVQASDGTAVCWGDNDWGQCNVPGNLGAVELLAAPRAQPAVALVPIGNPLALVHVTAVRLEPAEAVSLPGSKFALWAGGE